MIACVNIRFPISGGTLIHTHSEEAWDDLYPLLYFS